MSTIAPFLVGLVSSGVGYAYLSRELVTSRNRIMLKHFKAEGVEPYYPPRRKMPRRFGPFGSKQSYAKGSGLGSDSSSSGGGGSLTPTSTPSSAAPASAGEHQLVTDAHNWWNAAVLRCSDTIVGALYGRGRSGSGGATKDTAIEGGETRES
ncbi:unnamed protein product [Pylaiella littoralis]